MYAPNERSTFDALRAELERIWRAQTFDALAYARCVRALDEELARLNPGRRSAREKLAKAGRAGALATKRRRLQERLLNDSL